LTVYPNPTDGFIHIEFPDNATQSPVQATVYDLHGQPVFSRDFGQGDIELNLQLPSGVYLLRIIAGERVYSELITIQK
jgi:hypothetical protein